MMIDRCAARLAAALAGVALCSAVLVAAPARAEPNLTLRGTLTGADHQTYRELAFRVPRGVTRLTVEFEHTGREQRSVIDLGLRDPQRFRGWSGGNKARFTLAETFATASYLPGPLPPGEWRLILGVPNLRKDARADYVARISFGREGDFEGFAEAPLKSGSGWYRGDLHLHTGHSDGWCADRAGGKGPCPLHLTLDAAAARGLDFVAVTEHNATSHHQALAELQPHYADLLLIPGREITTFWGHANVFGSVESMDFQLGGPRAPSLDVVLDQAERAGALVSINHPGLPSGEVCMGCGWTAKTDYGRIQGVEVVNGGSLAQTGGSDALLSGVPFWEARLNEGRRLTALGGSDNHDAARPANQASAIGVPTTVVWAENLSQPAILAGLRSGRAFVDVAGTPDRMIDLTATVDGRTAQMGQGLSVPRGSSVELEVEVRGAAGGRLSLKGPAAALMRQPDALLTGDSRTRLEWTGDGAPGWVRAEVRGPDGKLWLLSNPVYLEAPR